MKKILLFVLLMLATLANKAQVWAPSGATWHYDWIEMAVDGYAAIQYINDSTVGGKVCKVLRIERHTYNWITHTYSNSVLGYEYTYLENNIVYYYRYGQFFKLYDFSANAGNSWEVAGWEQGSPCDSTGSIVVDSTGFTNINSFSLKYLNVSPGQNSQWEFYAKIIERIGSLGYMFPGPNCLTDISGPGMLRCYYDNEFGLYKRSGFPPTCDYITGIADDLRKNDVKIYPVPTSSTLTIEVTDLYKGDLRIEISNSLGCNLKTFYTDKLKSVINLQDLTEGIYFITISNKNGLRWSQKIIKMERI